MCDLRRRPRSQALAGTSIPAGPPDESILHALRLAPPRQDARPALEPVSKPPRTSGGGGSARTTGFAGGAPASSVGAMALPLHPPCVLAPLDPSTASRTRGVLR